MAKYYLDSRDMRKVADKIRQKLNTTGTIMFPDEFVEKIDCLAHGDAVRFLDFDGSIYKQYNAAEFMELTALPENPSHDGLTAQGWNWTLEQAKAFVAEHGFVDIGQMYITDDGKTRLYITIPSKDRATVPLYWGQTVANGVTVNWGDGSDEQTFTGTGNKSAAHEYAAPGDYIITLASEDGCTISFGGSVTRSIIGGGSNATRVYQSMLTNMEIGSGVTAIGSYAFEYSSNLNAVSIPNGITELGQYAFRYSGINGICIPSGFSTFGTYCFAESLLARISFPYGLSELSGYMFNKCNQLSSIVIPGSVDTIPTYAFSDSPMLRRCVLGKGITTIKSYAFNLCKNLSEVKIPNSVTTIESYAFYTCCALKEIEIPESVTSIGNTVFTLCASLIKAKLMVDLSGGGSAGLSVFSNCNFLQEIEIGVKCTTVPQNLAYSCRSVKEVKLKEGVTSISNSAFSGCQAISKFTVPSTVTSIGTSAFQNCYGMAELHVKAENPPTLTNSSFTGMASDCKIYVPADSVDAYKAASNWSSRASYIYAEPA